MPCYNPQFMIKKPESPFLQDVILKAIGSRDNWHNNTKLIDQESAINAEKIGVLVYQLPCGKCTGCREEYAKQWAIRCQLESKNSISNYFITLTYDDEHIPQNEKWQTLCKDDITKFIKDLRRSQEYHEQNEIRFFLCGEYGDQSLRPHYHAIIFNLILKQEETHFHAKSKTGYAMYTNDRIEKIWGKGFVTISEATWENISYVARYTNKKFDQKDQDFIEMMEIEAPFIRMSRRPGIGHKYLADHMEEIYKNDEIWVKVGDKTYRSKPPKAFDRWVEENTTMHLESIKEHRRKTAVIRNKILEMEVGNIENYMGERERAHRKRYTRLNREM